MLKTTLNIYIFLQHNNFAVHDLASVSLMPLTREGTQIRRFALEHGECLSLMFIKAVPRS